MKITAEDAIALGIDPTTLGFPDAPKKGPKRKAKRKPMTFSPIPVDSLVLGIDPSSSACGVAWMRMTERLPNLIDHHLIKPNVRRSELVRIDYIVDGLLDYIGRVYIHLAIIEWANLARWHGGARSGSMAPVITAQSAIREAIRRKVFAVETYSSNVWAGGVPKRVRAQGICARYPSYARCREQGNDPGFDVADAVGLGEWRMMR